MSDTGSDLTTGCFDVMVMSLVNTDTAVCLLGALLAAEDTLDSIVAVEAMLLGPLVVRTPRRGRSSAHRLMAFWRDGTELLDVLGRDK